MNASDADRQLLAAAAGGDLAAAEAALAHGANPLAKTTYGWTPLLIAAQQGRAEMLPFLAELADPAAQKNSAGEDPLFVAVKERHVDCAAFLLPLCDPRAKTLWGETPLMRAAAHGDPACVRLLLPASDPDARDQRRNRSALMLAMEAAEDGDPEALECFAILAPKSDLSLTGAGFSLDPESPLLLALGLAIARSSQKVPLDAVLSMMRELIVLGADTEAVTPRGAKPSEIAARGDGDPITRAFRGAILERDRLAIAAAANSAKTDSAAAPRRAATRV
jgi:hypothetical protein